MVTEALRMGIAAVAGVTRHFLFARGINACSGEIRIDHAQELDHFTRDVFARIRIVGLPRCPAMAVGAIHIERVAPVFHQRMRSVNRGIRREYFEIHSRGGLRVRAVSGLACGNPIKRRFGFRLRLAAMAGHAIDLMVAAGERSGRRRKERLSPPHQRDHVARRFFQRVGVGGEIAGDVTICALHAECFVESEHHVTQVDVGGYELQILGRRGRLGALSEERAGRYRQRDDRANWDLANLKEEHLI